MGDRAVRRVEPGSEFKSNCAPPSFCDLVKSLSLSVGQYSWDNSSIYLYGYWEDESNENM